MFFSYEFLLCEQENHILSWTWGGFQGARGATQGAEWYVENIFEELDVANEWFFDESTKVLYFMPNTSGLPEEVSIKSYKSCLLLLFNVGKL